MSEEISITLSAKDAEELEKLLDQQSIPYESLSSARNSGVELFVTIILPTTLTAVQVAATFLASGKNNPASKADESTIKSAPNIRIGHMVVGEHVFSVELIERKLGRELTND